MTRLRLLLLSCAALYAIFIARTLFLVNGVLYATLFDDAMISMRYARNLAGGAGLVWNPGGERVQGYTNPGWTFMMAGIHALGTPARLASLVVMIVAAAILVALTAATYRLARRLVADESIALGAAALTGFAYAVVYWSLRGMEVGLLALLLVLATSSSIDFARSERPRDLVMTAVALLMALWTRPDALVPSLIIGLYLIVAAPRRWRVLALVGVLVAVTGVAGPLAFGKWYYGSALPNTYYLKLGGISLRARIVRGLPALVVLLLRGLAALLVPAGVLFTGAARPLRRSARELLLLGAIVAAQCGYSVYVGGDAWEWMGYANRYIATVMPLAAVLAACGLGVLTEPAARRRMTPVFVALVMLHAVLLVYLLRSNRAVDVPFVDMYARRPEAVVTAIAAAALALVILTARTFARGSFAMTCALVWLIVNALPAGRWIGENAFVVPEDQRAAEVGLLFDETLAPDATFAVSWAGSTPYFADRTAVDLLGKSDPVIAHMPPVIPEFVPGHNRWDLRYSIGQLRPDLACNLPRRPGELAYLASQTYHSIGSTCFVRPGAHLDEARLAAGLARLDATGTLMAAAETR